MLEYPIFKNKYIAWLFLIPTLLVLCVFLYYPLWQVFVTSFYRSSFALGTRVFASFENYKALLTGPLAKPYIQVFLQTIFLLILIEVLLIFVSLILARLVTLHIKGLSIYQFIFLLTFALSPSVAGIILGLMYNTEVGIINEILYSLFHIRPNWLGNGYLAIFVTVGGLVWKNLGYNIVFYIAAIQNIPPEIDEAARMDGAKGITKLFKITAPLLSSTTFFLVFTNLSFIMFSSFGFIDIITAGGPVAQGLFNNAGATSTLMYKIFLDGFSRSSNIGSAAAQGVFLFILVIAITILNFTYGQKKIQYGENN